MSTWFNLGDKVVRIGDNTPGAPLIDYPYPRPQKGQVHCVSDCFRTPCGIGNQIWIVGFRPAYNKYGDKVGWPAEAFRKIEEKSQMNDIQKKTPRLAQFREGTEPPKLKKGDATMLNRRATAWLRERGLVNPYRRTAMSHLKEFKPL